MLTIKPQIIDELKTFLDEQYVQIEETLKNLDELRSAVVRRDHDALEQLQAHIQQESSRKAQLEGQHRKIRLTLAQWLECTPEEITISRVCECLEHQERQSIQSRQQQLQALVRKLQDEHQATELMLRECARFNRVLLSRVIGTNNQTRTYTVQGKEHWNVHQGLMNVKM